MKAKEKALVSRKLRASVAGAVPAGSLALSQPRRASLGPADANEIAIEAYIYAFPLVLSELTRRNQLGSGAAMNIFLHMKTFPDATFTQVVRPNADTLYSTLWFDVSKEPLVIGVPDTGGRYYLLSMLDLWSDVFAVPGSRTTGNAAQRIVIAGPGWTGDVLMGATVIRAPTAIGWIIGRTQTNGAADYANVHKFQDEVTAMPLSRLGKAYAPPKAAVDPSWDVTTPPPELVEKLGAKEYFQLFAQLLPLNPPHANDYPVVHRMAQLGIEPGKPFSFDAAPAQVKQALEAAPDVALATIKASVTSGERQDGWRVVLANIGTYGTNYRARAGTAWGGLGANPVEDAVYPTAFTDADGQPFSSDRRYVLHFSKNRVPPVRAFWSLTMYDARQLFAANPINRFAIGDRDQLRFNPDGSLDLYIQRASPGPDKESNWLPAPARGPFTMNLRLYWPKAEVLAGTWSPPAVRRVL